MAISEPDRLEIARLLSVESSDTNVMSAIEAGYGAAGTALRRKLRILHNTEDWSVLCRDLAYRDATLAYSKCARDTSVAERIAFAIGWRWRSAEG